MASQSLEDLVSFQNRIYSANAFLRRWRPCPKRNAAGLIPQPERLLEVSGQITRVGISDEALAGFVTSGGGVLRVPASGPAAARARFGRFGACVAAGGQKPPAPAAGPSSTGGLLGPMMAWLSRFRVMVYFHPARGRDRGGRGADLLFRHRAGPAAGTGSLSRIIETPPTEIYAATGERIMIIVDVRACR